MESGDTFRTSSQKVPLIKIQFQFTLLIPSNRQRLINEVLLLMKIVGVFDEDSVFGDETVSPDKRSGLLIATPASR